MIRSSPASFAVERPDRARVLVLGVLVEHPAAPQRVVERDQPARADEPQQPLVVPVVAGLVGVDEREVVRRLLAVREQPVERLGGRGDAEVDLPATPASAQYLRASEVHSSETSQQTSRPSSGSASATAVDE